MVTHCPHCNKPLPRRVKYHHEPRPGKTTMTYRVYECGECRWWKYEKVQKPEGTK